MKKTVEFFPGYRYIYDSSMCSSANGFCQINTVEDAGYYGIWLNPEKLIIFEYVEGDCITIQFDYPEEFVETIRRFESLTNWYRGGG